MLSLKKKKKYQIMLSDTLHAILREFTSLPNRHLENLVLTQRHQFQTQLVSLTW